MTTLPPVRPRTGSSTWTPWGGSGDHGANLKLNLESHLKPVLTDLMSRQCMREDLPALKRQEARTGETGQGMRKSAKDKLDETERMDALRQKWEEQEVENLEKASLTYTDVRCCLLDFPVSTCNFRKPS